MPRRQASKRCGQTAVLSGLFVRESPLAAQEPFSVDFGYLGRATCVAPRPKTENHVSERSRNFAVTSCLVRSMEGDAHAVLIRIEPRGPRDPAAYQYFPHLISNLLKMNPTDLFREFFDFSGVVLSVKACAKHLDLLGFQLGGPTVEAAGRPGDPSRPPIARYENGASFLSSQLRSLAAPSPALVWRPENPANCKEPNWKISAQWDDPTTAKCCVINRLSSSALPQPNIPNKYSIYAYQIDLCPPTYPVPTMTKPPVPLIYQFAATGIVEKGGTWDEGKATIEMLLSVQPPKNVPRTITYRPSPARQDDDPTSITIDIYQVPGP